MMVFLLTNVYLDFFYKTHNNCRSNSTIVEDVLIGYSNFHYIESLALSKKNTIVTSCTQIIKRYVWMILTNICFSAVSLKRIRSLKEIGQSRTKENIFSHFKTLVKSRKYITFIIYTAQNN